MALPLAFLHPCLQLELKQSTQSRSQSSTPHTSHAPAGNSQAQLCLLGLLSSVAHRVLPALAPSVDCACIPSCTHAASPLALSSCRSHPSVSGQSQYTPPPPARASVCAPYQLLLLQPFHPPPPHPAPCSQ